MPIFTSGESVIRQTDLSVWKLIALSLRSEGRDYTDVPLKRAVLLLAIPMVLEMIMESMFSVANIFWVSRLGTEAVAVIGLTESVMLLISAIAIGLGTAGTAVVARRIGGKQAERAAHAAGQIIVLGAIVSVALGVTLGFYAGGALRLMGADESTVALGSSFTRVMLGCNVTLVLFFLVNAILRGAGDAVLAMRALWLANALNMLLAPVLIFGWGPVPELGLSGAAVATNIGRGIGVLYQIWNLTGHRGRLQVRWDHLKLISEDVRIIVTTASNAIVQVLVATATWVGSIKLLALYGSAALAGYTIAIRIILFAVLPAFGLASAGATLVGQNLGAGKPERAEAAIRITMRFNVIFLGVAGAILTILAQVVIRLFTTETSVLDYGVQSLRIGSLALPLHGAGLSLAAAFNGAGDTRTPMRVNTTCLLIQIIIAWFFAEVLELGPLGFFIAVPVALSASVIWSAVLFRRGRWMHKLI